jgi:hypothetical protein
VDLPQAARRYRVVSLFEKLYAAGGVTVAPDIPFALQRLQDRPYAVGGTYPEPLADLPYGRRPSAIQDHILDIIENLTLPGG